MNTNDRAPVTPFGVERAAQIWAQRGIQGTVDVTPGEDAYVRKIWDAMPGYTCWMDAFHRIRLGHV